MWRKSPRAFPIFPPSFPPSILKILWILQWSDRFSLFNRPVFLLKWPRSSIFLPDFCRKVTSRCWRFAGKIPFLENIMSARDCNRFLFVYDGWDRSAAMNKLCINYVSIIIVKEMSPESDKNGSKCFQWEQMPHFYCKKPWTILFYYLLLLWNFVIFVVNHKNLMILVHEIDTKIRNYVNEEKYYGKNHPSDMLI